jgi:hypothetical protein
MNDFRDEQISERDADSFARSALSGMNTAARSSRVNRTHRVVRERAQVIAAQRDRERSLWVPLTVSAALVMIICTALWNVLDQYEAAPMGVPSASNQFLVLLIWFFPVSMALLAMVWFRRTRKRSGREAM